MKIIIFIGFLFIVNNAFGQNDTLTVYFIGDGVKGEKLKLIFKSDKVAEFRVKGNFIYKYTVPLNYDYKEGENLAFYVYRKGPFCFFYREIILGTIYDADSKYLVIYRTTRFKNKYGVDYFWTDEIPTNHHVVDRNFF